jgi:hypothetical protein
VGALCMPNRIREGDAVLVPKLVDRGNGNRSCLTFPHVCEGQAKANRTRSMSSEIAFPMLNPQRTKHIIQR